MTHTALRRQLYREGKRLLGPDRMARLRARSFALGRLAGRQAARTGDAVRGRGRGAWLDSLQLEHIDATGLLITGRAVLGSMPLDGAELLIEGEPPIALLPGLTRFQTQDDRRRRDGNARGFAVLAELPPGRQASPLPARLRLSAGCRRLEHRLVLPAPARIDRDPLAQVRSILNRVPAHRDGRRALFDHAFGPAIERLWNAARQRRAPVDGTLAHYGRPPSGPAPRTSVIVPVYGRCDFIEHQIAHFSFDPDFADVQLLYVIDDPRLHASTRALSERLARCQDLPFSVLYLSRNSGYACANNAGARHARGEHLLLLNSDVLPCAPGWLSEMYASLPGPIEGTLLGSRLLYEDGTLQHDGMRFESADSHEGQWLNRHPGKGLPAELFPAHRLAQPRQAITGACLLLARSDWDRLGGLDEAYLLGDFEDSDLCLRARQAGLRIRIATGVTLFHLERQSQALVSQGRWKEMLTYYNCWYQTRRWHGELTRLTEAPAHG